MRAKLVDELIPTDRILQRWAFSVGDGLHDVPWSEVPYNRAQVLDDRTAIVVDQLVLRSPPTTRKLVELWYRTTVPNKEIARKIRCDEHVLIVNWNAALHYFRAHFETSPLTTLRKLAQMDVADRARFVYHHVLEWFSGAQPKNHSDHRPRTTAVSGAKS